MTAKMLRIRLRWPPLNPVVELEAGALFRELVLEATKLCSLKESDFCLKSGFPPREIQAGDSTPIGEVLRDGDSVTVHITGRLDTAVGDASGAAAAGSSAPRLEQHAASPSRGGAVVHTLSDSPAAAKRRAAPRKSSRSGVNLGSSEGELSVNLVDIFSRSSGDLSKAQKALKSAFHNAVQLREASTIAENRLTAAQTGTAAIEEVIGHKFKVTFPVGGRSTRTEVYTALPKNFMSVVLREVYTAGGNSRMNLRPHYMAEGQPLMFWNIFRHFGVSKFSEGLKELMPFIKDWSFYTEDRERPMSEKAAENMRQREEAKARRLKRKKRQMVAVGEYKEGTTELTYNPSDYSDSVYSEYSDSDKEKKPVVRRPAAKSKSGQRLGSLGPACTNGDACSSEQEPPVSSTNSEVNAVREVAQLLFADSRKFKFESSKKPNNPHT